jgi:LysM repeat protein
VVVPGDTFDKIHNKFPGVTVKAIEQANPGVDPKRLKIGQKLHIPAATSAAAMGAPTAPGTESATPGGEQTYKVKSGDTLDAIHKKFHVSIKAIQSANNLKTTSIRVGQTLKIPSKAATAPEAAPAETTPPAPASTPTMPPPTLAPATPTNH